ncbi:hypothetical protein NLJ89_g10197 [Agrocybe chaxingu]|uniref:Arginase n=1 Tax=Agrocybe chaxingu TaxID=84603 RepID=A0A9W8MR49_9AGAR|nr:hypothetical protein NLJ89_g10197 [Agrocybe chaxingu]
MALKFKFIAEPRTVAIVSCPFRGGQTRLGVDQGPIHFIEAGLIGQLEELGWKVKFEGHLQFGEIDASTDPPIGVLKNPRLVSHSTEAVAKAVGKHAAQGELPLSLGGDHSLVSWHVYGVPKPQACPFRLSSLMEGVRGVM